MSRELHYCRCGQSIFHDMTECGDCDKSTGSVVIGIDPGTEQSAFVMFDGEIVMDHGIWPNAELALHAIWGQPRIFCEMIASYGMAVGAEVFDTCTRIGRIEEAWESTTGGIVRRVLRQKAKMHLCNSPRAKDANVSQALKDKLGEVGTSKNPGPLYGTAKHAWAALAVAVYAVEVAEES